jgi:cytochrome c-type biogenesis protein
MARSQKIAAKAPKLSQKGRFGLILGLTVFVAIALSWINWAALSEPINNVVYALDERYHIWLSDRALTSPLLLIPIAFLGGLIASISPCVLGLLPINLGYIGTRDITSRRDAFLKASSFVLGVATTYSLLGLFSGLAVAVFGEYRGYIQVAIGILVIFMALALLNLIRLPLPQTNVSLPVLGPYGVGLTFAFVSSPCSSPVMFTILLMAGEMGSAVYSTLTMISYAIGYTMVIFLASLFAGFVKQTRSFIKYANAIVRVSSILLIFVGTFYLASGVRWLWALWTVS